MRDLTQMPLAKSIGSVRELNARDVTHHQGDIPYSTSDPDLPGTGLNECIVVLAYLKDGDCHGIVRTNVDQFVGEVRSPQLDSNYHI